MCKNTQDGEQNDTSQQRVAQSDQFCRNCCYWRPYREYDREPEGDDIYPEVGGYCGHVPPEKWEPLDYGAYPPWVHSGAWCKEWKLWEK